MIAENTQNSLLSSNKRLVAVIGLKDLVVINKDLERVSNKLKNSKFLESAPEEVIEREKRIYSQSEIAKENIENILNQLN